MHTIREQLNGVTGEKPVPEPEKKDRKERIRWTAGEEDILVKTVVERKLDPAYFRMGLTEIFNKAIIDKLPPHRQRHVATLNMVPELEKRIEARWMEQITQPVREVIVEKPVAPKPEKTVREFSDAELQGEMARREEVVRQTFLRAAQLLLGEGAPLDLQEMLSRAQKLSAGEKIDRLKRIGLVQFTSGQIETLEKMTPNHEDDFRYVPNTTTEKGRLFAEEVDLIIAFRPRVSWLLSEQLSKSEALRPKLVWVDNLEKTKVIVLDYFMGKNVVAASLPVSVSASTPSKP